MRHYCKGTQLRRAGFSDWRRSLAQMMIPDPCKACVLALQHELGFHSEQARVDHFVASTGYSRATYYRTKAKLVNERSHHTKPALNE